MMRVLGVLGIALSCVGFGLTPEAYAQRNAASKAQGNYYDFYAAADSPFQFAGHRHRRGGGGGCGCDGGYDDGGYGYQGYGNGYGGYAYDDYGQTYGYRDSYGSGYGGQEMQYGYRANQAQPGDEIIVTAPRADLMRGEDVLGSVDQGVQLHVYQVQGPWIGTAIERDGQRIGGWIWFEATAPAHQDKQILGEQGRFRDGQQTERGFRPRPGMEGRNLDQPSVRRQFDQQRGVERNLNQQQRQLDRNLDNQQRNLENKGRELDRGITPPQIPNPEVPMPDVNPPKNPLPEEGPVTRPY